MYEHVHTSNGCVNSDLQENEISYIPPEQVIARMDINAMKKSSVGKRELQSTNGEMNHAKAIASGRNVLLFSTLPSLKQEGVSAARTGQTEHNIDF